MIMIANSQYPKGLSNEIFSSLVKSQGIMGTHAMWPIPKSLTKPLALNTAVMIVMLHMVAINTTLASRVFMK